MSTENTESSEVPQYWRERMRAQGKEAFQLEEMRRLAFWPPPEGVQAEVEAAEAQLKEIDRQSAPLRKELREVEAELSKTGDVVAALDEIRRNRIERVKRERAERKIAQANAKIAREAQWKIKRQSETPFLGHEVSVGLQFSEGNLEKLAALGLPNLQTAPEISAAIGLESGKLAWLCYHRGASQVDHYRRFQIPKRSGGVRNVSAPKPTLRLAQSWVLNEILTKIPIHDAATAFHAGASTVENARRHMGKSVVVRLDLKDFFPSVNFHRVKVLFQSFGFNQGSATIFALLCTESPRVELTLDGQTRHVAIGERVLPQGACTSPAISNLICRRLDARLSGLAAKMGFIYSRYADDLIFSSNDNSARQKELIHMVRAIIRAEKLVVNDEKTLVMRPHGRQSVTGLVVNSQNAHNPRPSRKDLHRFRAILHRYETLGREKLSAQMGQDSLSYLRGYLSYLKMSDPARAEKLVAAHEFLS